jgi:predicted nucleic acid-binding protein
MGRGTAFTHSEDLFLSDNAEHKTAREIFELHQQLREDMLWPERSIKSLARRVERLREEGQLGIRDEETRRKAYYERHKIRGE